MAVINDQDTVRDVVAALVELGITTATLIESQGMGKIVREQMPIFAGFRHLWGGANPYNTTLFTVVDDSLLAEAVELIEEVMYEAGAGPRGVVFALPVSHFRHPSDHRDKK
ncbi:MAG TPA: hypothetical protein PKW95_13935 [bacterium]|nr:hypothetical protein [bacterium]